jgi:DNA polymerase-3 subunit delta
VAEESPIVYVFHGDDEFSIKRRLAGLRARMGDPSLAELNTTFLDGRTHGLEELRSAALAMPFLLERRMVIVTDALARLDPAAGHGDEDEARASEGLKTTRKEFLSLLDALPPTTAVVLIIPDSPYWKREGGEYRRAWRVLTPKHWLMKWCHQAGKRALVVEFPLPESGEMPAWIRSQAKEQGGQFTPQAAAELAAHVGTDTRVAAEEITKLLTYVNCRRAVEADDVELLTAPAGQPDVWAMVDALGAGDPRTALRHLHDLEELQEASYLFAMVVRQFRLLIMAREGLDEGLDEARLAGELRQQPFVMRKICQQAQRFTLEQLKDIYRRLLEIDRANKTSSTASPEGALEAFIAGLGTGYPLTGIGKPDP